MVDIVVDVCFYEAVVEDCCFYCEDDEGADIAALCTTSVCSLIEKPGCTIMDGLSTSLIGCWSLPAAAVAPPAVVVAAAPPLEYDNDWAH